MVLAESFFTEASAIGVKVRTFPAGGGLTVTVTVFEAAETLLAASLALTK